MREPDIDVYGWCLDNGEEYHRAAPDTFWIPAREAREGLLPGDLVKLIFRISVDDPRAPIADQSQISIRSLDVIDRSLPGGVSGEVGEVAEN